jgi:hypothetical protein
MCELLHCTPKEVDGKLTAQEQEFFMWAIKKKMEMKNGT